MKIARSTVSVLLFTHGAFAFVPLRQPTKSVAFLQMGYLDDLSKSLYAPADDPDVEANLKENTDMAKEKIDRYGPGDWNQFVDFDEFDGGDGQMGVAGDGNKKLEKFDTTQMASSIANSRSMSAKNAWGTSTGYADKLIDEGVDTQKAQQMENWQNQREVQRAKQQQRYMTEQFDKVSEETSQWDLSKFGVGRNQDFDLDETFGAVTPGQVDGNLELSGRMNFNTIHEFSMTNEFMGFADFRAAFVPGTSKAWSIEPSEGCLSKDPTNFVLKFRPDAPGFHEGMLVIETEDFKRTYYLLGKTS